jgi:hypothetical protein
VNSVSTPKAKRAEVAARRDRAVRLRIEGQSWQVIADQLGYASRGAACQDVARALDFALKEQKISTDQWRELQLQRLDALRAKVWGVVERRHVALSGGTVVRDVDPISGETSTIVDDGPTLAAVDRLLKIEEREARLRGLDAPVTVDAGIKVRYELVGVDIEAAFGPGAPQNT